MTVHTAEIEGVPMRWEEHGSGPAVVLVHGIPTSPALWRKVVPRLPDVRALAWEMVGYGESISHGRDRDISVARQAGYLLAWLRHLGVAEAVFVGHDLGGGVVQIAAVREPAVCAGIVLTNAVAYDSWPIPSVRMMRAMAPLTARFPLPLLRANLSMLLHRGHDDRQVAKESLDIHFGPYARHGGARALVRQMKALDTRDTLAVQDELGRLRGKPARVVWGAADSFQKVYYGERLAQDLGAELVRIEGGKHFVPEDHPDVLADAVRDVVAAVPEATDLATESSRTSP